MFADAWNSVVATWSYLMGMPQDAARGLLLSTTIVVVTTFVIWLFKRTPNLFVVVGPLLLVGAAFAFNAFGQWVNSGFFVDLMKISSLLAFIWAVAGLVLALFTSRPLRK